ncbi:MAG: restriction endonuclease [bacterium]
MNYSGLKNRLLQVPGAAFARDHLMAQGHTQSEAEVGGMVAAGLVIFLTILCFNSFLLGMIRGFFSGTWVFIQDNPAAGAVAVFFATLLLLGLLFRALGIREKKQKDMKAAERRRQAELISRKESLNRGGWAHFEQVFRARLGERYPEIEVRSVRVMGGIPRIQFAARMFRGKTQEEIRENFNRFQQTLLNDTLHAIQVGFEMGENAPALIVDALMSFVDGRARFYDGTVLSVKAEREIFRQIRFQDSGLFKDLSAFQLRYNDGMEVEAFPEEEDKQTRILERIRSQAPRLDIRYGVESKAPQEEEGWEVTREPALNSEVSGELDNESLSGIPLARFQAMAQGLLSRLGYDIVKVKKIPGGTLQLMVDFPHPVLGGRFMVLARQYPENAQVHADLVRELDELAREESCKRAIYLVTGLFTEEARNISRKIAVDIIDGPRLKDLLRAPMYRASDGMAAGGSEGLEGDLGRMTLLEFETASSAFLRDLGLTVERIRRTNGGAVVAVVEHPHPVLGGRFAVLAKQTPENTELLEGAIHEFGYVMNSEFCHRGLFLSSAFFSTEARALARVSGLDLVDRNIWENFRRRPGVENRGT